MALIYWTLNIPITLTLGHSKALELHRKRPEATWWMVKQLWIPTARASKQRKAKESIA